MEIIIVAASLDFPQTFKQIFYFMPSSMAYYLKKVLK